jgi:hypothetical protein
MRFSQKLGLSPTSKQIQKDSVDEDLRNSLWNVLEIILDEMPEYSNSFSSNPFESFRVGLFHDFLKKPLDSAPVDKARVISYIRNLFFNTNWYTLYDLIEFVILEVSKPYSQIDFKDRIIVINQILEREFSAYRFIELNLVPITNESEQIAVTESLELVKQFTALKGCNIHLSSALSLLSDRKNPDYRNSIKESILSIEAIVKVISDTPKHTLGQALDKINLKIPVHAALQKGFKQLYGYTSDSDGIRHSMMEESKCDFEDAKYMLVTCSAFINYLIGKCSKAGIDLK